MPPLLILLLIIFNFLELWYSTVRGITCITRMKQQEDILTVFMIIITSYLYFSHIHGGDTCPTTQSSGHYREN